MMQSAWKRKLSALTAAAVIAASGFCQLPAEGAGSPYLTIEQVSVTEESLADGTAVAVDVTLCGNTDGFLAASFGIAYDISLTFDHLELGDGVGTMFEYASNDESGVVWFAGACGDAADSVSEEDEVLCTLYFTLPETAVPGDQFRIDYLWKGLDGSSAFWKDATRSNIIGNMQADSQSGSISVFDPDAASLSSTNLSVHIGGTKTLQVLNYTDQVTWVSSNTNIATVTDGAVTGVSAGSCQVYAFLSDGSYLICNIQITEDAYYEIAETDVIYLTDPEQAVYVSLPESDSLLSPSWLSSNTAVVTVENGKLTGLQNGSATVYAIVGSQVYSVIVIVEYPEENNNDCLIGDVDLNGIIDVMDVIALSQCIMGISDLEGDSQVTADAYHDELIDNSDTLAIMKYLVKLETTLPVEIE